MFKLQHFCLAAVATALPAAAMADIGFYMGAGMGGSRVERDDVFLSFDEYTTGTIAFITDPPYNVAEYREQAVVVEDPEGTDFAFKVFGGARFGSYLGVEAGYINLGTASDGFPFEIPPITSTSTPPPPALPVVTPLRPLQDRQIDVETTIDGFQATLVGFLPVGEQFEFFAKIGLLNWDQDTKIRDAVGEITPVDQPGIPEIILCPAGPTDPDGTCTTTVEEDGETFGILKTSDSGTDLMAGLGVNMRASEKVSVRAELEWFDIDGTSLAWAGTVSLVFDF